MSKFASNRFRIQRGALTRAQFSLGALPRCFAKQCPRDILEQTKLVCVAGLSAPFCPVFCCVEILCRAVVSNSDKGDDFGL